jgi:hypothetical protein
MSTYVTPIEVAKQIGKPTLATSDPIDPKLLMVCDSAEFLINDWIGVTDSLAPVPSTINVVAVSLAVDLYKQADATFGVIGAGETGMVRIARDLLNRYDSLLIPFYDPTNGWGVA